MRVSAAPLTRSRNRGMGTVSIFRAVCARSRWSSNLLSSISANPATEDHRGLLSKERSRNPRGAENPLKIGLKRMFQAHKLVAGAGFVPRQAGNLALFPHFSRQFAHALPHHYPGILRHCNLVSVLLSVAGFGAGYGAGGGESPGAAGLPGHPEAPPAARKRASLPSAPPQEPARYKKSGATL